MRCSRVRAVLDCNARKHLLMMLLASTFHASRRNEFSMPRFQECSCSRLLRTTDPSAPMTTAGSTRVDMSRPRPSLPFQPSPVAKTAPRVVTKRVCDLFAATAAMGCPRSARTSCGVARSSSSPKPSLPCQPCPQLKTAPSAHKKTV